MLTIDGNEIDLMVKEEDVHECSVTEHPTERGLPFSDNIQQKSQKLTIEGLITNTPLDPSLNVATPSVPGIPRLDLSRAEAVYQTLCDLWKTPALIPIKTTSRIYNNMALVTLTSSLDDRTGNGLRFVGTFQSVEIVDLKTSNVAVKTKRGQGAVSQGAGHSTPSAPSRPTGGSAR